MRRILGVVAAISIVVAACSAGDDVVASVNGVDLNRSRVEILIPESAGETVPSEFSRFLTVVIQWEAVAQAAESDFGIDPTEQEIDVRLEEFVAGLADGTTLEAYLASVNASVAGIREFARQLVIQDGIESRLADAADRISDDTITDELVNARLDWTVVCASHILVETVEDAEAVTLRLDGGETFATVAGEVSLDPGSASNGGDLGCNSPSGFVDSFAAATMVAEIDVPTAPVESDFGFHIILVSQREEATQALVRDALVDGWFVAVIASAEVSVDEAIGVWVTEPTPQVLATN